MIFGSLFFRLWPRSDIAAFLSFRMSSARIISAYEKEVSIKRWRPLGFYPFNGAVSANDSAVDAVDASLDVGEDGVPGLDEGCDAVSFQLVGDILDVDAQIGELVHDGVGLFVGALDGRSAISDANQLIKEISADILYLDPPYNARQYCANYHMLETIAKYDSPKISGKTGLREYKNQKSLYCSKSSVKNAFADLIQQANVKYIFLSYNNEGLLSVDAIREIMSQKGEYGYFTQEYNRFKADSQRDYKTDKTTEYLHYCIVKN